MTSTKRREKWLKYRESPEQNYSELADFWVSPDHVLIEREAKGYFTEGTAFELIVQDACEGSKLFEQEFIVADGLEGSIPDELVAEIEAGTAVDEIEKKLIVKNKDGSESKARKRQHAWVHFYLENPGRMVIGKEVYDSQQIMMEHLFKLDFQGFKMRELLREAIWQYPIYWKSGQAEKKMLLDCAITMEDRDRKEEMTVALDIKTCANLPNFERMMRSKYWIQSFHYSEGLKWKVDNPYPVVVFLAVEKEEPYRARRYEIDPGAILDGENAYRLLSSEHAMWSDAGRKPVGIMPPKFIKPYYTR